MYNYDNEYEQQNFESDYEFDMENESENEFENFENESEYDYESAYDHEMEYEDEGAFEQEREEEYGLNGEYEMENEYSGENEFENEFESDYETQDEITVRDHRTTSPAARSSYNSTTRRVVPAYKPRPVVIPSQASRYRTPSYQRPYYSRATVAARRPAFFARPPFRRPAVWPGRVLPVYTSPWYNRHRPYPWPNRYGQPQFPAGGFMPAAEPSGAEGQSTAPTTPGFLMDTIRSLSQQVAATNASVAALERTINNPPPAEGNTMPAGDSNPGSPANGTTGNTPQVPAGEMEFEDYEYDLENEMYNYETTYGELNEEELAAELLATNNEQELDHFLSSIIRGIGRMAKGIGGTAQGKILKKLLKKVAKQALPIAGAATGGFFGGPLGAKFGQQIGSSLSSGVGGTASEIFGLEMEGLSHEDGEYEVAKAIVRLADDAARELAEAPAGTNPAQDAKNALIQAATRHAPGLLVQKKNRGDHQCNCRKCSNWQRREYNRY